MTVESIVVYSKTALNTGDWKVLKKVSNLIKKEDNYDADSWSQ